MCIEVRIHRNESIRKEKRRGFHKSPTDTFPSSPPDSVSHKLVFHLSVNMKKQKDDENVTILIKLSRGKRCITDCASKVF